MAPRSQSPASPCCSAISGSRVREIRRNQTSCANGSVAHRNTVGRRISGPRGRVTSKSNPGTERRSAKRLRTVSRDRQIVSARVVSEAKHGRYGVPLIEEMVAHKNIDSPRSLRASIAPGRTAQHGIVKSPPGELRANPSPAVISHRPVGRGVRVGQGSQRVDLRVDFST